MPVPSDVDAQVATEEEAEATGLSTTSDRPLREAADDDRSTSPAAGRSGGYSSVHADTNHGTMIGQWFEAVRRHSGAALPPEWVARELADYSAIGNEEEAALLLKANQVIVLVADNLGNGRWTAALRLLTTAPGEPRTLRRVRRETGEAFSMEGLQCKKRTGWILDLRETEEGLPASCDFGLELHQVEDLRDDDSYLAVLVGTELWERIGHGAGELVLTPQPPDPATLFTTLLRSAGVTHPEAWADDHRFRTQLPQLLPGQVWDWARILVQSDSEYRASTGRGTEPGTDGFEAVAKAAGNAVSGWMDVLAKWHSRSGRTSYDRNYLLLAAVCDGAPIDNVHLQIASLAQEFGEKGERSALLAGQQGPGLIQLAREIEAVPRADGHLTFPGPGFAEAVVRYFWQDRPELIDAFTKDRSTVPETQAPSGDAARAADGPMDPASCPGHPVHPVAAPGGQRLVRERQPCPVRTRSPGRGHPGPGGRPARAERNGNVGRAR
ncbi:MULTISPECIES: hypothetical protein [unclassified Streptomyces]|uniref:hypothetical protein n=1 Tax=unclassified Streptomyces TaxID=2593676 RepID=UPI003821C8D9|nr:hypothetical protein OG282_01615 [Streptomyces sp. NBC_01014]